MKFTKRLLSTFLAAVMMFTALGISSTAYAADTSTVSFTFTGTERNDLYDDINNYINDLRWDYDYYDVDMDESLTKIAIQRAKDVMVYAEPDTLPNGKSMTTKISTYGEDCAALCGYVTSVNVNSIANSLAEYLVYSGEFSKSIFSVGYGIFTYSGITSVYAIFSFNSADQYYTDFTKKSVTASVTSLISNLKLYAETEYQSGYIREKITGVYTQCPYGYSSKIKIPISQFNITSSNSSITKVKNGYIYPKKNGKYKIYFKNKKNSKLAYTISDENRLTKPKTNISSLKSTSKGKMTVKWQKNVTNADGYQVQYSKSSKYSKSKTVTVKGRNSTSKTISKLTRKKKYYVRVRAYVDQGNGEKLYSAWGPSKSVKIK